MIVLKIVSDIEDMLLGHFSRVSLQACKTQVHRAPKMIASILAFYWSFDNSAGTLYRIRIGYLSLIHI